VAASQTGTSPDLATLDPATLDYRALRPVGAQKLFWQLVARGDFAKALGVLQGEIAELEAMETRDPATIALFYCLTADTQRVLRRFEPAFESLETSERLLSEFLSDLDPTDDANRALWDWGETLRTGHIGERGWIHQDLGAYDTALSLFEQEQAELDALADAGIDVRGVRLDADKRWANLAVLTQNPERIEALLAKRRSAGELTEPTKAYLQLRLAIGLHGSALGGGEALTRAREAYLVALQEPALEPIDHAYGELGLARLESDDGRREEARALWNSVGRTLEELSSSDPRIRRAWVAFGASLAENAEERTRWMESLRREIELFLDEWHALDVREDGYGLMSSSSVLGLFSEFTQVAQDVEGEEHGTRMALEILARAHAESTLARQLGAAVPTVEEIRAALCPRPGQGVLVYLAGPSRSWVFALDSRSLRALPLVAASGREAPRKRLVRELLASGGIWSEDARVAARELTAELLPAELQAQIEGWHSIAVCGLDLFLGDVPFELLELEGGRTVGAEKAVWWLPPLAASVELARRAARVPPAAPGIRLIAAPALSPTLREGRQLAEFELVAEQLEAMLGAFPPETRSVFLGADAHVGALHGALPPVLQFLAHATFDERRARSAELALAAGPAGDDGLLSAIDVERRWSESPAPRLVVLTACRAGRSVSRHGDFGATDLAGAFLGRGSSAVVASPYDLDLALACRLSSLFYAALARGADAADALRQSRAELARDPEFASSAQPFLMRAIGFAPAPCAPFADVAEPRSWPRIISWACILVSTLVASWALSRRVRKTRLRESGTGAAHS